MNVEYINPFVTSTFSVFSKMLSWKLVREGLSVGVNKHPEHEISGVIGLSGNATGTVVLSLDRDVAISATEAMLGERHAEINAEVIDTIGELTNMVAGAAKSQLEQLSMSVSLPNVIVGRNHVIQFPSDTQRVCISFQTPSGPLSLEVGLAEQSA